MRSFVDRGGWWVAGQVVLFAGWGAALLLSRPGAPWWLALPSVGLAVAGGALAVGGLRGLGVSLTPYPEPLTSGRLVEAGAYGLVRHPIYGGIGLGAIGLGMALGSYAAALVGVLLLAYFRVKAAGEERRLVAFYPEYPAYQARVRSALVPWVL